MGMTMFALLCGGMEINYASKCSFHLLAKSVDEVHPRDEKDMTKEQIAQKKADENYFHTNRDINKDGVMDKVTRQMCIK